MQARRDGRCPACRKEIKAGSEIQKHMGAWVHAACAAAHANDEVGPEPTADEVADAKRNIDRIVGFMLGRGAPVVWDGMGFNKMDYGPGNEWVDRTEDPHAGRWAAMADRLAKYKGQLSTVGVVEDFEKARNVLRRLAHYDDLRYRERFAPPASKPVATEPAPRPAPRPIPLHNAPAYIDRWGERWIKVAFPYDAGVVAAIKDLPKRRWDNDMKAWLVAPSFGRAAATILRDAGMSHIADAIMALPGVEEASMNGEAVVGLSRAATANEAGDAGKAVVERVEAALRPMLPDGLALYPFQSVGVGFVGSAGGQAIIGDEMGTGKTIQALAFVLAEIAAGRDPFPVIVVCPAVVKLNWEREARTWLAKVHPRIAVINGRSTPAPADAQVVILNFDLMRSRVKVTEHPDPNNPKRKIKDVEVFGLPTPGTVIVDEFHKCKNRKAQQTASVMAYAGLAPRRLFLSGTPILNRPEELWPALSLLRPLDFGSYWRFANRYCGATRGRFGTSTTGATNLDELRKRLLPIMLHRTKDQVLTDLPPKRRVRLTLDLANRAEYERAEADVARWLGDLAHGVAMVEAMDAGADLETASREASKAEAAKRSAALRAEHLVKMNTLRKLAGRGKVAAAMDWIEDLLDTGKKLVVWSHHKEVVEAIRVAAEAKFPGVGIVVLTGDTSQAARQRGIDAFQADPNTRLFIGTTTAGGIGVTLTSAHDVLFLEREWVPGDEEQAEDRCHRIGQVGPSVTVWIAESPDTIDQDFAEVVEAKRAVFQALIDGKEQASRSVVGEVTRRMMRRVAGEDPAADADLLRWAAGAEA